MKHIKIFSWNTLIGNRLNHQITLDVHWRKTDKPNAVELAKGFKGGLQARLFGLIISQSQSFQTEIKNMEYYYNFMSQW